MFRNRWRIDAVLTTSSSFHLGDGGTTSREKLIIDRGPRKGRKDNKVEIASVAVDHAGRACIPGRSLKGALRSWLDAHKASTKGIGNLFGRRVTEDDPGAWGIAEFCDALLDEGLDADPHAKTGPHTVPYWCAKRHTGVVANVAIDRQRRTAVDRKLFHREFVPPGVSFRITVVAQDLGDEYEDIALLLSGLRAFSRDLDPLSLGADTRDGWGRFAWTQESVHLLEPQGLDAWLKNGGHAYEKLPKAPKAVMESVEKKIADLGIGERDATSIDIEIAFDGPFLVSDPLRAVKAEESSGEPAEDRPDHVPLREANGNPALPASAFRGALRSQAERIVRTLGLEACEPNESGACRLELDPEDPDKDRALAEAVSNLCIPCALFGAVGWATCVEVAPFTLTNQPKPYHQELVAIDRFTGGVSGSAKFDMQAVWQPAFRGRIRLDSRVRAEGVGLLALALRDLEEGDIRLGFGAAKGYGSCQATLRWADPKHRDAGVAELRRLAPPEERPKVPDSNAARTKAAPEFIPAQGTPEADAFWNPYHFVPAKRGPRATDVAVADFDERRFPAGHDRFGSEHHSGRILCRLTAETAVVVGGEHESKADDYTVVHPFRVPIGDREQSNGEPAIPATSLRGLISSVAEAASNSALRVLHEQEYSYRCSMGDALHAIGMIDGSSIRPLALPLLESAGAGGFQIPERYRRAFAPASLRRLPVMPLKAFVNGYRKVTDRNGAKSVSLQAGTFLAKTNAQSWSADHREFWYARLSASGTCSADGTIPSVKGLDIRPAGPNRRLVLNVLDGDPVSQDDLGSQPDKTVYTRGILRILGIEDRNTDIPTTKAHEIFIPYPEEIETMPLFDASEAIAEFHRLADERTDSQEKQLAKIHDGGKRNRTALPFSTLGSKRNAGGKPKDAVRLRDGDLVFFEPSADGTRAGRLAISSIWRDGVDGDSHAFFSRISPELVPFNRNRAWITIAEQMFGFVEQNAPQTMEQNAPQTMEQNAPDENETQSAARAFAGRVVVGFGRLPSGASDPLLPRTHLRILSSPKPPSPNLYFTRASSPGYTPKRDLRLTTHIPQGRKFYLHAKSGPGVEPWKTEHENDEKDQKASVQPLKPGTTFDFHVDFENLSDSELALLCYSLGPAERFRYKLGMGKPIGLGTVRVDTAGIFLVDRVRRYRHDRLDDRRYHRKSLAATDRAPSWAPVYAREHASASDARVVNDPVSLKDRVAAFRDEMDPDILRALELIGDAEPASSEVHTPQITKGDAELETYRWFVDNDGKKTIPRNRQYLVPLTRESASILPLYGTFDQPYPRVVSVTQPKSTGKPPVTLVPEPVDPVKPAEVIPIAAPDGPEARTTARFHVACKDGRFFVIDDPRVGRLQRAVRGTEGILAKRIGNGREVDVTLEGQANGTWRIGTIEA